VAQTQYFVGDPGSRMGASEHQTHPF
jgi:hypothetical protein